jgi:hypothetical protein
MKTEKQKKRKEKKNRDVCHHMPTQAWMRTKERE